MSASSVTEKLEVTLKGLVSLEGVRSAFVMDRLGGLKAHKSKGKDSEHTLIAMARYLQPVIVGIEQAGTVQHLHLRYTTASFFVRTLLKGQYIVLFFETGASLPSIIPSLNLAVFGMEKTLQGASADSLISDQSLVNLVNSAQQAMEFESHTDTTFFGSLRRITGSYFGKTGHDILSNGIESLWITLPIKRPNDMRSIVDFALDRFCHPVKRECFRLDAEALIRQHSDGHA